VLEMSARAMERPQIWKDVAWHWYRSLTFGSDDGTRMLRILRGMWSAWRGGDPMEMVKLMQVYTVMMHGKKNYREAAAGCVRAAMFYSEAILMTDDKDSRRDMHHAMNSLLDVGSDLFRRAGDIGPRFAIKDILDMSKKHHL